MVNLAESQALQNLAINVHKRIESSQVLLLLQLLDETSLGNLVGKDGEPCHCFFRIMRLVIELRCSKEDALFNINLENFAPGGEHLPCCPPVGVGQLGNLLAESFNLDIHSLLLSLLQLLEPRDLAGETSEELRVGSDWY